ncbi:MAG: 2Fe-2S iron-sulfur cluster-binding protein [Tetrasphaera sp.]
MVEVTFVDTSGTPTPIRVATGTTLMRLAVDNVVPGVVGQCGGNMMCGTCHVVLSEEAFAAAGPPHPEEEEMLMFLPERQGRSRLGCQVPVSSLPVGAVVHTPEDQPGV